MQGVQKVRLGLVLLLATIVLVYWPGLGGGFVFDDYPNIVQNVPLHVTRLVWNDWIAAALSSPSSAMQRPMAMLTFAVNHYFTGMDPVPMKLTNVLVHALNALLAFGLVRGVLTAVSPPGSARESKDAWLALFISSCWALHPINLMAVLFVVQRMESLSHVFVFAGLWMYVAGRLRQQSGNGGWFLILGGLLACTSLGVLAKESAVLLPLYAFCLELCIFRFMGPDQRRDRRLTILFVIVLAIPAVIGTLWLLPKAISPGAFSTREFNLSERLLTEPRVVLDYLRWIVLPDLGQLSLYHDDYRISRSLLNPPATIVAILALPALLVAALFWRSRRPLASLGVLWFIGAQALTATFLPLELVFEHRNYFASLGICLALADLLLRAPASRLSRLACATVAVMFLLACAGITHLRAREWSNPVRIAVAEAAKHPQSPRATYYLGWVLVQGTGYRADSPLIQPAFAALDRARSLPNSGILPDQAALVLAARTGTALQDSWWQHMQTRLSTHPLGPQEMGALGGLMTCSLERHCNFPPDQMLATFGSALSQGPNAEVLSIYGNYVLNVLGDAELGLRLWQEARDLNPAEPQYQIGVIKLLIEQRRFDEAGEEIARLRKMGRVAQYAGVADSLDQRRRAAEAAYPPTAVPQGPDSP